MTFNSTGFVNLSKKVGSWQCRHDKKLLGTKGLK